MTDISFPSPVVLRMPSGGERKVATSFEALECLEREWPQWARGRRWRSAMTVCRDALDGWRTAADAQRSFVKAATGAGLIQNSKQARRVRKASLMPAAEVRRIGLSGLPADA